MLSRRTALIAVSLLIFSALAPVAGASQHNGQAGGQADGDGSQADGNQTQDRNQTDGADGNQTRGDGGPPEQARERRQQARQRARQAGLFGTFTYSNGQADGRFVSFGLDPATATVTDLTLTRKGDNLTVFDEVAPEAFSEGGPARVTGSVLQLAGEELRFQGFDNPSGLLKYQARRDVTVTFDLAENVSAQASGNSSRLLNIQGPGNFTGTLVAAGNGTATAGNGTATVDLQRAGVVLFRADPANATEAQRELSRGLDQAASEGKLGASTRVAGVNGTPVQQNLNLTANATAEEATDGRVRVEVSADRPEGKVVHLSIAEANLNVSTPDQAAVKFDGERIPIVDSIDPVVNATEGDPAKAHVLVTNESTEVTVWVPDFSIHTITTKDVTKELADLPTPPRAPNPTGAATSFAAQARAAAQDHAQRLQGIPQQARDQAFSRARQANLFGSLSLQGGDLAGAFVSATVDGSQGTVSDLAVQADGGEATVLSQVTVDPYSAAGDVTVAGPVTVLPGSQATVSVHDTPRASVQAKAGDQAVQVNFTVPDDAEVEQLEAGHLKITVAGLHAHLVQTNGNGDLVVQGRTIVANLGANAGVLYTVHPPDAAAEAPNFHERLEALKDGNLGAEAALAAAGQKAVGADTSVGVSVVPAASTASSVSATVASQVPDARAVTLTVPKEDLNVDSPDQVDVTIDGQPVAQAQSVAAVLQGQVSGDAYAATDAGQAIQVVVNVGGFSEHTVTTSGESTDDGTTGNGAPLAPGLAVLALAGAALVARRRR